MDNTQDSNGYLIVRVLTGLGAYPVSGAMVSIVSENGKDSEVIAVDYTDEAGIAGPFTLYSGGGGYDSPENVSAASKYSVEVDKDGDFAVVRSGVSIYPGRSAIQTIYMTSEPDVTGKKAVSDNTQYSTPEETGIAEGNNEPD